MDFCHSGCGGGDGEVAKVIVMGWSGDDGGDGGDSDSGWVVVGEWWWW